MRLPRAERARRAARAVRGFGPVNALLTHALRALLRRTRRRGDFWVRHLPHRGVTRLDLPGGRSAKMWSRGDDWVSNQVFWRGWEGYEPEMSRLFWSRAGTARVTLDVGAHVGFHSILAGAANPAGRVFAFEPLPAVFDRLVRNLGLSALENVTATQAAVGASSGEAEFFHVPGIIPCSSSLSPEFMAWNANVESTKVRVLRLDEFATEYGIATVDLMKLDTETTEPDVLRGMGELLARTRPEIFCEVLESADGEALTEILGVLGYRFFLLTGEGPQPRPDVRPDQRWTNYLFTTREAATG